MIQNPYLVHADEMVASLNDSTKAKDEDPNSDKVPNDVENYPQVENHVKESDRISENVQEDKSVEKAVENTVKAVNKTALNELIEKIRNTDLQNKTVKSVENLNLSLSRAQAVLDKEGASQDEINKEVQVPSDSFAQLEEKSNDIDKKEKQADKANDSDEKKKLLTEKIAKVQALVSEINQLAGEISYEFSESESKSLQAFGDLSEEKSTDSEVTATLNEAKSLRNKVANRVTRAHSGKRDPRNGKPIDGKGESGFRGITYTHKENRRDGKLIENGSTAVYYNSDEIWSLIEIKGERVGNERKFTTYARGKVVEDVTPYYIVTVGFTENSPIKGLKMQVAYWDKKAGVQRVREIEYGRTEINNPITNAAIRGVVGEGGIVQPGRYEVHIASNTRVAPNQLRPYTFTFIIKPQSERNTVKDLSQTYVDDVRHLTENEKTALIEKFKAEHPDIMKPSGHKSDFERAEISADGTTMTIHFKDGFNPKTIQTNATNDVEAKHSSLTAYFGDSKELYTNPRELVRSKTGHEVPATAQVTYKTPFNLQQAGTRNVVVTTTYQNGVNKDVTTPYTVLDFIGKQDKKINQNQSGQLGDARNYVTVSNDSAVPGELTVRWKGGSSNVDTSAAGIQHKEIEILRGNHLMKTVNIPVEIVDNINPTITAPDTVTLTRAEGLPTNISVDAQDNARGIGLKDANPIVVENLANPLRYNPSTKRIELSGVIPNQLQSFQATVKAVDKKGNTATKAIRFNVQAQTDKYTATANPQKQTVSYLATPSAEASVSTTGLPIGTRYTWKTTPNTSSPGDKSGVVEVTYPDTSKDTVNVTVAVRKLSDEYVPTGTKIVRNQNASVTNNDLKAAVSVNNNGNSKVKSVTASPISTVNAGTQTIKATVTYLDNTTDPVDIPLEVKDVTDPTIQTPNDRQNWDLIALDRTLPSIKVTSVDNNGGTGIKSTTVTGLPDFLVYDNATKTIKFKNGVQEVTKLPVGQDSKTYNATIQVTDNSNNSSQRQITITVKSMTTKYTATPNSQKQTVSYGEAPDAGTSVNKNGLPTGTAYTWATTPSTTTGPGDKSGVVMVTYPDGSKDTVNVKVAVRKLSDEYAPTGNTIVRNQNVPVSNDDLKTAVTISNNGNNKVKSVTPVGTITTVNAGTQIIRATVTYLDNTTDPIDIPLEVKDVTAPTIQTPTEGQLWEVTSLDKTFPSIKIAVADNPGGSGVKGVVPMNLPSFLKYDKTTSSIVFQDGVHEVPKLSGISRTTRNVTFVVEDNAGNRSERNIRIRQISMAEKYNPQANTTVQEVSYGETPNSKTSVNTEGLPGDTRYAWKRTPDTSKSGDKTGVVKVTYPDDSVDEVTATVKVRKLSDEYNVTGNEIVVNQNTPVTNDDLKAKVNATSKVGNVNGTDKISTVTTPTINTANYGEQNITATVTFKDGTTKPVTIPLRVKDVTKPTISAPVENTNWEMTALDKALPNMEVRAEDNANGSGIKNVSVTGLPDYLEYDSTTNVIKFKAGKQIVEKLPENTANKEFTLNIRSEDNVGNFIEKTAKITVSSMSAKTNPTPIPQNTSYGQVPDSNASVDKAGLPDGTKVTWKTPPAVTVPGTTTGLAEVTYPDGSKDTVEVTVNVSKLSDEYNVTGTPIEVNQNTPVTNDDLKAKVTATSKVGNVSGTDKISTVTAPEIITANYGEQNITATVTFKDGTTKPVTIPLKVKDVTKPTIQSPTNGQNWDLIAVEGSNPDISVTSEDNTGGSGVKTTTVTGLPDFLEYNESTKKIQFKAGVTGVPSLPEGTDVQPHNVTITVVDNAGNETTTNVAITVKSMTTKYDANTNPDKQTVSYGATPDAGTSVNQTGLPEGTSYAWKTRPSTAEGPGEKAGVVEVSYKDGSKDTVDVTVNVSKLSDEYNVTGNEIEVNQNTPVTNDDLKAKVTATSTVGNVNGTDKISTVTAPTINTANYGDQTIKATVTFKDGTTKPVTIPLKVKDVTKPTIQSPTNGQNWDLIAVEGSNPEISVTSEDNTGGSGVKTTTVTGLPDFLEYNESTKKIQFKAGVTSVPSLQEGTDVQPHNVTITVVDNAENETTTNVAITVKSMTTKYDATANPQKQTVSYGETPDAGTSVNKTGLPEGTSYAWKTTPVTTDGPGEKAGVVEVTYKDGSKDTVDVKVTVKELSSEYEVTGAPIEVNQNDPISNDDLKAKVTATSKEGNVNGTDKISSVEPKSQITTTNYGDQNITATVAFKDGTTKEVTIPLKVKDVTKPTIQTPAENKNWEMTALDKALPNMAVGAEDNANGSGIKNVTVTGLPDYLEYDSTTHTIKFKSGKDAVEKLPENTPSREFTLNIRAEDNSGNFTERTAKITVSSMSTKNTPTPIPQNTSYDQVPDPNASVDKAGLPDGTKVTWKTPPVVNTPGTTTGVAEVTYPDGSKDTVEVTVNISKLSEEYDVSATEIVVNQNTPVTNDDLKAKVTATSKVGNANGTDKISTVTAPEINTANYGEQTINATVTFKDGTTKSVTIPLKVKDVTKPTISAPTNGQNWDLIAVEGANPEISVTSEDNVGGSGVKTTKVTDLPEFLEYNELTKKIQFKAGVTGVPSLPEGTNEQPHNITITVVDKAGNEITTNVTITVKSMTTKYEATANPDKQTVSYGETPDVGTSVNKTGLPEGTSYAWKTTPVTTDGPGEKDGVVEVTYKDGSKDTVNVKVTVKELSSEYEVSGTPIEVNQNDPVTNDDLKAKVTATSTVGDANGTDKISTVTAPEISTANYGERNITATVTFKDGTTKEVMIPLKVKDVTKPTIESPTDRQNWDLIAVEGSNPEISVTSEDNTGGSGVKTTTVTGLPDFLEYNESTKKIQFKEGVTGVPSLPEGTDVQPHNVTITVVDNAGNETTTNVTITVKSMTTKYDANPNPDKQTVSYGDVPDAGTSVSQSNLPEGTSYAWKTIPSTTTPGEKDGVVEVIYKDGSKDTVNVKVTVKELSSEYEVSGTPIEVNQNDPVTNDDLKAKVTATSKDGNVNGTDKISTVTAPEINTANYGEQTINATVTFKDGTTKSVAIPLKVKDVTKPTISAPTNGQNWDLIAVEGSNPEISVTSEDNTGGSGVKTTTVTGLPDFLEYNESTKKIQFKAGVTGVPSLPEGTNEQPHNITITVVDNTGNETTTNVTITVKSMTTKYDATPNTQKQTVSYGETPDAGTSVNQTGLPEGTSYAWKTRPVTTTPGEKDGVVEVTYKDGSKDTVDVKVTVKELSSEYEVTGAPIEVNQNDPISNDDLKAKVTATSKEGNVNGTDKISSVEPKTSISTANYGEQNITATVTFKDGTTKEVTIPLKVKDVTKPTISAPAENTNWEMTALDKTLRPMKIEAEDNANGSGIKNVTVTGLPDYLEYDSTTNAIKFKSGKQTVEKLAEDTPSQEFTLNIRAEDKAGNVSERTAKITVSSMSAKTNPTPIPQNTSYGQVPDSNASVDKAGLPDGTKVTWKTPPVVNTPGTTTGVAEVTYPDGSKDVVTVNVTVRKVSEDFTATGTQIEVNQNVSVTPEMLKGAVTATNAQGENGNAKIATVEAKTPINTESYGDQTIQAKVTYIDGSEQDVTIPLKVKDVTDPTIQTPANGQNWEMTALDKTLPPMKIEAKDNANGSGIATIEVRNMPSFLTFDQASGTIVFKEGVLEVPRIDSDNVIHGVTIVARDKAGNSTSILVNITVWSMRGKYTPSAIAQEVDNEHVPDPETSVTKTGLPEGTRVTWKDTPVVNTPGGHPSVALVTYPDGTTDEVTVPITVKE
ncbi:Rib/alpha-like domain-containing protein, partial [Streptococcus mitis]|uniref:Rib/alpha-like domain-containing protein n=1 Tax=Streptococcus mitis TaxID=28037 RepID=UPI0021B70F3D